MTHDFKVPSREQMSEENLPTYDYTAKNVGFMPNLYATLGLSPNGLKRYFDFHNDKSSLTNKEKEVVNLVVSEVNDCDYCRAAHTMISKKNGFSDEEILDFRRGQSTNSKYDALVKLAKEMVLNKGKVQDSVLTSFFEQGYTEANLIDVIMQIADKTITNYLHTVTQVPIDFPLAPKI